MRVIKSDRSICECGSISCKQEDNVYRDGYVSIENQFKEFQRAGINRMEWLKKAYPSAQTKKHEEALLSAEGIKASREAEKYTREELDIQDGIRIANERLANAKIEYEKEIKKLQEEATKIKESQSASVDKNSENV